MAQTDTTDAERLLLPYLLRLLPDDQAEEVELATLSDDEVAGRLEVVEHDLVDGYIRDTLDPITRERFESYYLSSPIRRERVRFAAEFLRAIDDAAANRPAGGADTAPSSPTRLWRLLAVAAALVLTSGTLLLVIDDRVRNSGPAGGAPTVQAERSAPSPASSSAADAPSDRGTAAGGTASIALVLLPQTRAVSEPPALRVTPGVSRVSFELRLESNDYSRYQAALRDPRTNRTLWRSAWTIPVGRGNRSAVDVAVPTEFLKAQHYSLDLTGRTGAGAVHVVGSYAFSVTPP